MIVALYHEYIFMEKNKWMRESEGKWVKQKDNKKACFVFLFLKKFLKSRIKIRIKLFL